MAYCCIAIFFLFKLTHLAIPYYWDELGVYSKAALHMYDTGITLLPGIIPPELSRGHPLVCTAFFATAYRLFGPHVWVGHLAALAVSIVLLVIVYRGGKKLTNHATAMLACLLLMLQPVFIAQSSMVLPEVLLALFSTAAIFAYIDNRFMVFAVSATLAIMTKETAIAIPVTIWSIEILRWFLDRKAEAIKAALAAFVPVACWGAFLLLQKMAHGWYFFPLHTDYVSFSMDQIFSRWGYYVSFLLKGQGRFLWTVVLASALFVYLFNRRHRLVDGIIEDVRMVLADKRPLLVLWVFICWGLVVSMLNFHLGRYSLFLLPSLCLLVAQSFFVIYEHLRIGFFKAIAVAVLLIMPLPFYASKMFNFDADMGFTNVVKVHTEAIEFLNRNYASGTVIMDSFPINSCMLESRAGYNSKEFQHIGSILRFTRKGRCGPFHLHISWQPRTLYAQERPAHPDKRVQVVFCQGPDVREKEIVIDFSALQCRRVA